MIKNGVRFAEVGDIWEFRDTVGLPIQRYLVAEVIKEAGWMECGQYGLMRLDIPSAVMVHEIQLCERYAISGWRCVT